MGKDPENHELIDRSDNGIAEIDITKRIGRAQNVMLGCEDEKGIDRSCWSLLK